MGGSTGRAASSGCGHGVQRCRQVSQPDCSSVLPSGVTLQPRSPLPALPYQGSAKTTSLFPSPAKAAGGSPEMADVEHPKATPPDGGLAAFQRSTVV